MSNFTSQNYNRLQHMVYILPALLMFPFSPFAQRSIVAEISGLETSYVNKIQPLDNGYMVLHRSVTSIAGGARRDLIVSRFDECHEEQWTRVYSSSINMELVDVERIENGDLLILLRSGLKYPALLRIDEEGNVVFCKSYQRSIHDFTYSLSYRDGRAMIYGAGTIPSVNDTRNYIILTDPNGNPQWSRQYIWSEKASSSLMMEDGSFICKSGSYFFRVEPDGNLDWVKQYSNAYSSEVQPIEYEGDAIFQLEIENNHFLSRITPQGSHLWNSDYLNAPNEVPILLRHKDEILLSSVDRDSGNMKLIKLDQNGTIREHLVIDADGGFHDLAITADSSLLLSISHYFGNGDYSDVLLVNPTMDSCFQTYAGDSRPNVDPPQYTDVSADFESEEIVFDITDISVRSELLPQNIYETECDMKASVSEEIKKDLDCNEEYTFDDPHPGFDYRWFDGATDSVRTFTKSGSYLVTAENCNRKFIYHIDVESTPCPCPVYIPNAISPNGDGVNDHFEVYNNCTFGQYSLEIYDRWGAKVFESRDPGISWAGTYKGKRVSAGMYVYKLEYTLPYQGESSNTTRKGELLVLGGR